MTLGSDKKSNPLEGAGEGERGAKNAIANGCYADETDFRCGKTEVFFRK